jgi:hypothetical protein
MKKIAKAKSGKSFGMLSVKAGIDKNPNPTAADRIVGAKENAGKAKYGAKVAPKKRVKKAQDGTMLPEALVKGKSLKRGMMDIALGDDRKMSIDTTGYKNQRNLPDYKKDLQTYNYTVSDKSGKVLQKNKLQSEPGRNKQMIVDDMVKALESGKMKRPTFKSGGKITAKKTVAKKGMTVKKMMGGGKCKNGC